MRKRTPIVWFDIDDTLVDQRRAEAAAASRFIESFGGGAAWGVSVEAFCDRWRELRERHAPAFLHGEASLQQHRRRRVRALFEEAEPRMSDAEADRRFAAYLEEYRRGWDLFDDVLPTLEMLGGQTLGVISNGHAHQQRLKLRRTGIARRFGPVMISEELGAAKPSPEAFHRACVLADCDPRDCLYIGDRLDLDARASTAAGMRGIWLNRRQDPGDGHTETIRSLLELPRIIDHFEPGHANAVMRRG